MIDAHEDRTNHLSWPSSDLALTIPCPLRWQPTARTGASDSMALSAAMLRSPVIPTAPRLPSLFAYLPVDESLDPQPAAPAVRRDVPAVRDLPALQEAGAPRDGEPHAEALDEPTAPRAVSLRDRAALHAVAAGVLLGGVVVFALEMLSP